MKPWREIYSKDVYQDTMDDMVIVTRETARLASTVLKASVAGYFHENQNNAAAEAWDAARKDMSSGDADLTALEALVGHLKNEGLITSSRLVDQAISEITNLRGKRL